MHRQYSMAVKLPAAVLSLCLLLLFVSWVVLTHQTNQLASKAINDKSLGALNQLDQLIRAPLFNNDRISVQVALTKVADDPAIFSASLFDVDNQLITQSRQTGQLGANLERFSRDIEVEDTLVGTLVIALNSQPIYAQYRQVLINWIVIWLLFTAGCTYASYRFSEQLSRRLRLLSNRLPGGGDKIIDELTDLEVRVQPLLSNSGQIDEASNTGYYYSLVTASIKNRQRLNTQLNRESLELLFEKIDYCTARTLELYGGKRIEGTDGTLCFYIRSTQSSKQHLLICLMAVYSLQQLLEKLSANLGVDLEINWTLCSGNLSQLPLFRYDEGMAALKHQCAELAARIQEGIIVLHSTEYDIEALSSIARFLVFDDHCFILQGFPEGRQSLLEKQVLHLANVCL